MSGARDSYDADGYLLVRGALTAAEAHGFRTAVDAWMAGWTPTGDSYEPILHQVHLPWLAGGELARLTTHPRLAALARELSGVDEVRVFLDQVVIKPPGGAATIPHQDAPFLSFDDRRSLNCWIALDDVGPANGALGYYRRSHRLGLLDRVHLDEDDVLERDHPALAELPVDVLRMRTGDAVFHHCLTVHRAYPNTTAAPRRAYSIQYMPSGAVYNGYRHDFLDAYAPVPGAALDFPCFAVPR